MAPTDFLNTVVTVTLDRPLGSRHPREGFVYPVNYGFVAGVPAPDGHDLDAYVLGISEPLATFTGRCIAVLHRTDDNDDKLIVVPDSQQLTDDEIRTLTHFQEQWFTSVLLRDRPGYSASPNSLLRRMQRVDPSLSQRYRQKSGE